MATKGILFNTAMVRAILDGRKTVTRRVIKDNVKERWDSCFWDCERSNKYAPYQPGDILWVRETWQCINPYSDKEYVYKATCDKDYAVDIGNWCPSIHMPREAARIFLRVTDVRAERLQEITIEDVWHEGVDVGDVPEEDVNKLVAGVLNWDSLEQSKKDEYFNSWARSHYMKCVDKAQEADRAFKSLWDSTIAPADLDRYG